MRKKNILAIFAVAIMAVPALYSCHKEEQPQPEAPAVEQTSEGAYILTVQAVKEVPTKALSEAADGKTIHFYWSAEDIVSVYKGEELLGSMTPVPSSGNETTLSGELSSLPELGDVLTLVLSREDYSTQLGTLEYIAGNCNYAVASITVNYILEKTVTTTEARFQNRQAIVKYALQNADGEALSASQLLVGVDGGHAFYTVNPVEAVSEMYVALPAFADKEVSLSARVGNDIYDLSTSGITFDGGLFYRITAGLEKQALSGISVSGLGESGLDYFYGGAPASAAR